MTTSREHQTLVGIVQAWCESQDQEENHIILIDDMTHPGSPVPPAIGRYRPDLVWLRIDGTYRFIGEAKTDPDINNSHTRKQVSCYLEYLELQGSGTLVFAVPWRSKSVAISIIAEVQRSHGYQYRRWVVISDGY